MAIFGGQFKMDWLNLHLHGRRMAAGELPLPFFLSDQAGSPGSPSSGDGNRKKSPNPLISETEKCGICGEAAAKHVHYGATTCFSCRAFFRRSIQNGSNKQYTCRKGGNCEISLKTRKNCQKCRFEKCLTAGMKPSWVLTEEERFRRFRKHREKMMKRKHDEVGPGIPPGGGMHPHHARGAHGPEGNSPNQFQPQQQQHAYDNNYYDSSPSMSHEDSSSEPMDLSSAWYTSPEQQYGSVAFPMCPSTSNIEKRMRPNNHPQPQMTSLIENDIARSSMQLPRMNNETAPGTPTWQGSSSGGLPSLEPLRRNQQQQPPLLAIKQERVESVDDAAPMPSTSMGLGLQANGSKYQDCLLMISRDEVDTISRIGYWHDKCYKSVSFGEDLIKEMLFSSVCGTPLSVSAAMTAYRLMIQRVNRVASGFDPFASLSARTQATLLKHNSDLVVSLRGAVFFETNKQGLDQIVISLGIQDCDFARRLITDAKRQVINKISYSSMNALQKINSASPVEVRYSKLMDRIGAVICCDPNLVKLLTYVLLFLSEFDEELEDRAEVVAGQETMIRMLQRYIFGKYPRKYAAQLFSKILNCITDLQELTWIKKQRQMATDPRPLVEERVMPTNANRPKSVAPTQQLGENLEEEANDD